MREKFALVFNKLPLSIAEDTICQKTTIKQSGGYKGN